MNEITDLKNIVSYYARMLLNATCADEKAFVEPKYNAAKHALVKAKIEGSAERRIADLIERNAKVA